MATVTVLHGYMPGPDGHGPETTCRIAIEAWGQSFLQGVLNNAANRDHECFLICPTCGMRFYYWTGGPSGGLVKLLDHRDRSGATGVYPAVHPEVLPGTPSSPSSEDSELPS